MSINDMAMSTSPSSWLNEQRLRRRWKRQRRDELLMTEGLPIERVAGGVLVADSVLIVRLPDEHWLLHERRALGPASVALLSAGAAGVRNGARCQWETEERTPATLWRDWTTTRGPELDLLPVCIDIGLADEIRARVLLDRRSGAVRIVDDRILSCFRYRSPAIHFHANGPDAAVAIWWQDTPVAVVMPCVSDDAARITRVAALYGTAVPA